MSKPTSPEQSSKSTSFPLTRAVFLGRRALSIATERTPLREMTRFHGLRNALSMEGFMRSTQYHWFEDLFSEEPINNVAEVGFNGGHSAFTFANLGAVSITSFDLGEHDCVRPAARYLEGRFPDTLFDLVLGDSRETIPKYSAPEPFDAVFIDGGHDYEIAAADIANLRPHAKPDALVIMDDYGAQYSWGLTGPKHAYDEAVNMGAIQHIETASGDLRGWALGRYAPQ